MTEQTIASLVRRPPIISPDDTLGRAAGLIKFSGGTCVLVADGAQIIGMVTESAISRALGESADPDRVSIPIGPIVTREFTSMPGSATLRQAAELMGGTGVDTVAVCGSGGGYYGVVFRSDIVAALTGNIRPQSVGGMATPLGVYLTTGSHSGGVNSAALVLTGASLMLMITAASLSVRGLQHLFGILAGIRVDMYLGSPSITNIPNIYDIAFYVSTALTSLLMLLFLRWSPLAGYHAAEHMTVHAIEMGESLTPDVVRNMPRVHPRCGTNILAASGVFVIITTRFGGEFAVLMAILIVVVGWRHIGGLLQSFVTTKNPTEQQLASGIAAGKELLLRYQANPHYQASGFRRVLQMGFLQTATGMILMTIILESMQAVFGLPMLV